MAEVYLARRAGPHGFQKLVALKRILPQLARDEDFVAMFVDEARVCARLSHPNIVQVFDFGEHDGELFMAMEYVDGTTGARLIRAAATAGVAFRCRSRCRSTSTLVGAAWARVRACRA